MLPESNQLDAGFQLQQHFKLEANPVEDEGSYRMLQTKFDHMTEINWKIETRRGNGQTFVVVSIFKVPINGDQAMQPQASLRLAMEGIPFRHQAELPLAERVAFVLAITKASVEIASGQG